MSIDLVNYAERLCMPMVPIAKHGIELRWKKGPKLRLSSYAVYINGACHVGHETTTAHDSETLFRMVQIEKKNTHLPII